MNRTTSGLGVLVAIMLALAACQSASQSASQSVSPGTTGSPTPSEPSPLAAAQYVANAADFVDAADWDASETIRIELSEFAFTPQDITLAAGQPYVLELVNVGTVKHEFTAGEFFRTVATRKAETIESEVKVPYFTEIEVFAGKTVELFLIPLIPGTYDLVCEIEGHFEAGMFGTITVTGQAPTSPAIELSDVASGAWVQNGSQLVDAADWDASETIRIELSEFAFTPQDITLAAGQPYVLELVNVGTVKHEFTAGEFFASTAFRKAEDASGEFKAPAPREIEVFPGQQTELYLIPTAAGTYDLVCEIEGHFEAGMFGTITVTAGS